MRDFAGFLRHIRKELRGSVNRQEVRRLTEQSIQKCGWEILEPFVAAAVEDLITEIFMVQAQKMLPYWISLATSHTTTRSIQQLTSLLPEAASENLLSEVYVFGSTPISEAINLASLRLLDRGYDGHQKILIIVSDGEFESKKLAQELHAPLATSTRLLKQADVVIITLYVGRRNVIQRLQPHSLATWPTGARLMHQIASTFDQGGEIAELLQVHYGKIAVGKKLCLQVNDSEILENLLGLLLGYDVEKTTSGNERS
jgi:hypothetical protein